MRHPRSAFFAPFLRRRRGEGFVGYALVVGLVAMAAVVALDNVGSSVTTIFDETAGALQVAAAAGPAPEAPSAPPANQPPVPGSFSFPSVARGQFLSFQIPASDPDGHGLTFEAVYSDSVFQTYFTVSPTGLITGTAPASPGVAGTGIRITDGHGGETMIDLLIIVN